MLGGPTYAAVEFFSSLRIEFCVQDASVEHTANSSLITRVSLQQSVYFDAHLKKKDINAPRGLVSRVHRTLHTHTHEYIYCVYMYCN